MAKTKSPLLSASAHGKLARSLIYSNKKSGQLTRAMHYPKKEPSLKQWTRRHIVGLLTAHWQCMTDNERSTWSANAAASSLNLPGYQYFLKLAQADLYTHHGLITYLSFNESTGGNFYCYSCDMIMGDLLPDYPDNCPTRIPSFKKEYGNALFFDGIDDYGDLNWVAKMGVTEQITIEAWIKLSSLSSGWGRVFSNFREAMELCCWMLVIQNDKVRFHYSDDGINNFSITSSTPLTLDWTHVVATLGLDNVTRIFINAVQETVTGSVSSLFVSPEAIKVGSGFDAAFFDGAIDELRLYNRALSYNEIKKHYELLRFNKKRQPLLRL